MTAPDSFVSNGEVDVELDRNARSVLEQKAKREFSDPEWIRMRRKLMEFYAVLSDWEKHAMKGHQHIG